ncbi:hypothetical protein [Sinomicrobium weinanense]|uniref:Uncharacterized protein n=1 Tax=Sinomicrobium weinanense TaxID=2842200 RepID=A0A926JNY2_9FLAO|nr:hypothetical protein [Sinomicrobium weinanense]MBC9794701.1 hypothetical protein [Sinomicrobium weinanense]MBU3124186.1 hypothetical protein [Sinomicrobium weinanense]
MALLKTIHKRVKASTLMETLVATVLIVVIFMVTSLILNNLFAGTVKGNTREIETRLDELEYRVKNNLLKLPHSETFGTWNISVAAEGQGPYREVPATGNGYKDVILKAKRENSDQNIDRKVICKEDDKTR